MRILALIVICGGQGTAKCRQHAKVDAATSASGGPCVQTKKVTGMCIDLGVNPNKSTRVDLGIRSQVGLILLGAVDPPSNLK